MQEPTIGHIVHYTLADYDASAIQRRREDPPGRCHGNPVDAGQVYPAVIVRVFSPHAVNLRVLLDGNDTYWATSRPEGDQPGGWAWPARTGE